MELPQPTHKNYTTLATNLRTGQIRIPQFQRDFVWTMDRSAALLDSIVKGYPIGTFIFWRTKEQLKSVPNIGKIKLPTPKKDEIVNFVLDGQQRLISLFATLEGLEVPRNSGKEDNFSNIYINLDAEKSDEIVTASKTNLKGKTFIRLTELLHGSLTDLTKFSEEYHEKLDKYKQRIKAYNFSIIEIFDFPIEEATDIFTKVNVSGKALTIFEIMVAKTYDDSKKSGFDLSEKYDELIDELEDVDYQTVSDQTVLRLIAQILKNKSTRKTILNIDKDKFIETWPKAVDALKYAIDHLRDVIGVPASQLLPYLDILVCFAYFFHHQPKDLTPKQLRELENFFWRCSLGSRYDAAIDFNLAEDIKRINQILEGESPNYDWNIDTSPKYLIDNGAFNPKASFNKAILCIMVSQTPRSFKNNRIVRAGSDWLKRSNSKNYHHFFPKAFLKEKGINDSRANNIVNITIVDEHLNKSEIGARPPSQYMKKFKKDNSKLEETMKTHLIGNLKEFGIWNDDYSTFMEKRAEIISEEMKKRIIVK